MSTDFSEMSEALLREWLSWDGWFRQSSEAEGGFWKFAVAMLQDTDGVTSSQPRPSSTTCARPNAPLAA